MFAILFLTNRTNKQALTKKDLCLVPWLTKLIVPRSWTVSCEMSNPGFPKELHI